MCSIPVSDILDVLDTYTHKDTHAEKKGATPPPADTRTHANVHTNKRVKYGLIYYIISRLKLKKKRFMYIIKYKYGIGGQN